MVNRNKEIEYIIDQLELKIKKHVKETIWNEQEDLSQEIKIKIIEKADDLLNEDVPGFFEYLNKLEIV